jgi:hypothetical protein
VQYQAILEKPESNLPLLSAAQIFWISLGLIVLLPGIGLLVFSPDVRGRLYLRLDQQDKVTRLYHRLLDNGSISDKLCLALLNQYMLENRTDELALKVFERALRLHLLTDQTKQEEVSTVLTQHYLGGWQKQANEIDKKINKLLDSEIENIDQ